MGSGQSISLNEAYELKLTPSLFKLDEDGNEEQEVDITNEHIDKITSYVTSKDFKQDVETVTDVSIRPKRENASTVQLKFKQSGAKYISSEGVVVVTGKWTSSLKQRKPSVKKSAAASTGNKKSAKQETSHLTMAVNVSSRQFQQDSFVENVLAALHLAGADGRLLILELTETTVLKNVDDVVAKMNVLKSE